MHNIRGRKCKSSLSHFSNSNINPFLYHWQLQSFVPVHINNTVLLNYVNIFIISVFRRSNCKWVCTDWQLINESCGLQKDLRKSYQCPLLDYCKKIWKSIHFFPFNPAEFCLSAEAYCCTEDYLLKYLMRMTCSHSCTIDLDFILLVFF